MGRIHGVPLATGGCVVVVVVVLLPHDMLRSGTRAQGPGKDGQERHRLTVKCIPIPVLARPHGPPLLPAGFVAGRFV